MERIASRLLTKDEKLQSILRVGQEITAARERWSDDLLARCPEFEGIYGRTPERLLRTLKQKTDCVLSLTYIHSAALCDPPTCGNGIPEGDEACDDGNAVETDGCRSDCRP
jgi:cysteine-rich repeat protein